MSTEATLTAGRFHKRTDLDNAVRVLHDAGLRGADISKPFIKTWGSVSFLGRGKTKALSGVLAGAAIGAGLGELAGWLADNGTLPTPSLLMSPFFTSLFCTGLGGLLGGIVGGLASRVVPEREPDRYKRLLMTGGFLLSVTSKDSESTAKGRKLLQMCGAQEVATDSDIFLSRAPSVTAKGI